MENIVNIKSTARKTARVFSSLPSTRDVRSIKSETRMKHRERDDTQYSVLLEATMRMRSAYMARKNRNKLFVHLASPEVAQPDGQSGWKERAADHNCSDVSPNRECIKNILCYFAFP